MTDRCRTKWILLGALGLAAIGTASAAPTAKTFTPAQAARGKAAFDTSCAACHGASLAGGPGAPPLAGPKFQARWNLRSTTPLFSYMREKMPPGGAPLKGGDATYADVLAYILRTNGAVAGDVRPPRR